MAQEHIDFGTGAPNDGGLLFDEMPKVERNFNQLFEALGGLTENVSTDNAVARFDGTEGIIQNSTVLIDDNGVLTAQGLISQPAVDTLTKGIHVVQSITSQDVTISESEDSFGFSYNFFDIDDGIGGDVGTAGVSNVYGIGVLLKSKANAETSRVAIFGQSTIDEEPTGATAGTFYSGLGGIVWAKETLGGTDTGGGAKGSLFSGFFASVQSAAATNYFAHFGVEISTANSGTVAHRIGLALTDLGPADTVAGDGFNAHLSFGSLTGATAKTTGILLSSLHGQFGLAAAGTYIYATAGSLAYGVDLELVTFSGAAFRSPGFSVDPDGDLIAKSARLSNLQYLKWRNGAGSADLNMFTVDASAFLMIGSQATAALFETTAAPSSNGGQALGFATLAWSTLFLASGGVINFNNGDVTLTHSADDLLLAGGTLTLSSNLRMPNNVYFQFRNAANAAYENVILFTAGDSLLLNGITSIIHAGSFIPLVNNAYTLGSGTNSYAGLFLASGAVINWNNGTYTLTQSGSVLTASGAFSVGTGNPITAGTFELGHATDTTLSRSAAGRLAVEGVNAVLYSDTIPLTVVFDGGGIALTTGVKLDLYVPYACTIQSVTMLADQSGSVVVDIWKDSYANYPPTVADTITASAKPTITTATKSQDATLTGWTTSVAAGSTLRFNIDSATTITRVTLTINVVRA